MSFEDVHPFFVEIAQKLAEPDDGYPEDFLIHVAYIISKKGLDIEEVSKKLPSSKIICDDINLVSDISKKSRCYFGCVPISYIYFEAFLGDETLEGYSEIPSYTAFSIKIDAPFTKTQFIESIGKKVKTKIN